MISVSLVNNTQFFIIAGVLGVGGYLLYKKGLDVLPETVSQVSNAVNPLNDQNVFAEAVNDAGSILTQDENFSLGGWFYDVVHGDESGI